MGQVGNVWPVGSTSMWFSMSRWQARVTPDSSFKRPQCRMFPDVYIPMESNEA